MGLKLDMSKAYDRIEWDFVQAMLLKMGFASQWVGWVMRCLSSVEFAVLVNGKVGSYFTPTRGLRQGDPLSPYLFIIVSDVLSSMINQAATHGFIQGMKFGRGGPTLSHLFFADDSLMFLKATENNCRMIVRILDSYCMASGQLVNFEKSNMFFSPNTPLEVKDRLRAILNVSISEDPGNRVHLWTDKWIPGCPEHALQSSQLSQVDLEAKVETIIDCQSREWILEAISGMFSPNAAKIIRAMHLGDGWEKDRLIWPLNQSGSYTVKSGYNLIHMAHLDTPVRPSSSRVLDKALWKLIWGSQMVPKLMNFWWRLVRGCLPTRDALFRRHLGTSPLCPICGEFLESVEHLFLLCNWVQPVWFGGPLNYRINRQSITSMSDWMMQILKILQGSGYDRKWLISQIVYTCWSIWKSRCSAVFDDIRVCPRHTLLVAQNLINDFNLVRCPPGDAILEEVFDGGHRVVRWSPPPTSVYKINIDASWVSCTLQAGLGVVVRNSAGNFMGGCCVTRLASSAIEAEAHAALKGVKLAAERGFPNVVFESDSKELVQSVKGNILKVLFLVLGIGSLEGQTEQRMLQLSELE
ncbi:unnamed protein product [Prunus brigantina]